MPLMDEAEIVPSTSTPSPGLDSNQQTLIIDRGNGKRAILAILAVVMLAAGVFVAYRFTRSGDASASLAGQSDGRAEASAVTANALPEVCLGDSSKASGQIAWYCQEFMPWRMAVDAKLNRLDADISRNGGVPPWVWITIPLLGANSVLTWILLLRRRKNV